MRRAQFVLGCAHERGCAPRLLDRAQVGNDSAPGTGRACLPRPARRVTSHRVIERLPDVPHRPPPQLVPGFVAVQRQQAGFMRRFPDRRCPSGPPAPGRSSSSTSRRTVQTDAARGRSSRVGIGRGPRRIGVEQPGNQAQVPAEGFPARAATAASPAGCAPRPAGLRQRPDGVDEDAVFRPIAAADHVAGPRRRQPARRVRPRARVKTSGR